MAFMANERDPNLNNDTMCQDQAYIHYAVFGCIETGRGIELGLYSKSKEEMNWPKIRFCCLVVYGNCLWNQTVVPIPNPVWIAKSWKVIFCFFFCEHTAASGEDPREGADGEEARDGRNRPAVAGIGRWWPESAGGGRNQRRA
jgi:hypothetical protein